MKKSAVIFDARKLRPPGVFMLLSLAVLSFFLFFSFQKYVSTDSHTAMAQSSQTVTIQNMQFMPSQMNISVGSTITWSNQDSVAHTVTSDRNLWDSGILQPGQTFAMRFMSPGIYTYHCRIHPFMQGRVVVTNAAMITPSYMRPSSTNQYPNYPYNATNPQTGYMPSQPMYYPVTPTYSYSVPAHTTTQTQNQSQSVNVSGGSSSGVDVQQNESQFQTVGY